MVKLLIAIILFAVVAIIILELFEGSVRNQVGNMRQELSGELSGGAGSSNIGTDSAGSRDLGTYSTSPSNIGTNSTGPRSIENQAE